MDYDFETMYETINALTKNGFENSFVIEENSIRCTNTKKDYSPQELLILRTYRFDGMTNPSDDVELFAIEANDGTKGTLVIPYGAEAPVNSDLVRQLPMKDQI